MSEVQLGSQADLVSSNQYLNYLRVTLQGDYQVQTKPFNTPPPDVIICLPECLANKVADAIPDVPRAGENIFQKLSRLCLDFYPKVFCNPSCVTNQKTTELSCALSRLMTKEFSSTWLALPIPML